MAGAQQHTVFAALLPRFHTPPSEVGPRPGGSGGNLERMVTPTRTTSAAHPLAKAFYHCFHPQKAPVRGSTGVRAPLRGELETSEVIFLLPSLFLSFLPSDAAARGPAEPLAWLGGLCVPKGLRLPPPSSARRGGCDHPLLPLPQQ